MHPNDRLIALINHWHAFEMANPEADLADFCRYYLVTQDQAVQMGQAPESQLLGRAFGRMSKFAQLHSKQLMADLGVATFEDWLYLLVLAEKGTPKKSELIYEMLTDFTTGIEIIKRLVKGGFAEEFPDETDKRSKRLRTTAKGREALQRGLPRMADMGQSVFEPLTVDEKKLTLLLLNKLDAHHTERWQIQRRSGPVFEAVEETHRHTRD